MKNLLIILMISTLLACSNNSQSNDMEEQNGYYLNAGIEFSIVDSDNKDLLNPENLNYLDINNIKLFYLINGEKKEIYNPNMDYPRNFLIYQHENEYRIRIFLNHTDTEDKPMTYVQWSEKDIDTIETIYRRTQNSIIQETLWLNGEQIWEIGDIEPYFVLIK
jgi:hypothetical protein